MNGPAQTAPTLAQAMLVVFNSMIVAEQKKV